MVSRDRRSVSPNLDISIWVGVDLSLHHYCCKAVPHPIDDNATFCGFDETLKWDELRISRRIHIGAIGLTKKLKARVDFPLPVRPSTPAEKKVCACPVYSSICVPILDFALISNVRPCNTLGSVGA
jgi:hypothetical protein